jgi:hypothetical protein
LFLLLCPFLYLFLKITHSEQYLSKADALTTTTAFLFRSAFDVTIFTVFITLQEIF